MMKETIIFMHGIVGTEKVFEAEKKALQNLYKCYSYNYYEGMKVEQCTVDFFVSQLLDQFKTNNIESAHLCALSFGSLIARVFAEKYPDRVRSLVFVGGYQCNPTFTRHVTSLLLDENKENYPAWVRKCAALMNPNHPLLQENCEFMFEKGALALSPSLFKRVMRLQFDLQASVQKKITCPVLWIMGEYDHVYKSTLPSFEKIGSAIEYKEIKQAGHVAHIHQPKAFLKEFQMFLRKQNLKTAVKQA